MSKVHAGLLAFVLLAGTELAAQAPVQLRISAERDGILVVIGAEVKKGEKVAPDRLVAVLVGNERKPYRIWKEGDTVEQGDLLARLDDRLVRAKLAVQTAALEVAEAKHKAAGKMKEEAKRRLQALLALRAKVKGAVSDDDLGAAIVTVDRYVNEEVACAAEIRRVKADLAAVQAELAMYEIRSPSRGVIARFHRMAGEAVKKGQPVLILHPTKVKAAAGKELTVPAQREGRLVALGIAIPPDEKVSGDVFEVEVGVLVRAVTENEKVAPEERVMVPGSKQVYRRWNDGETLPAGKLLLVRQKMKFRPLEVGDEVREGQLLGLVNPALVLAQAASKSAALEAAEANHRAVVSVLEESKRRLAAILALRAKIKGAVSDDDIGGATLTVERYVAEEVVCATQVRQVKAELVIARTELSLLEIRSPAAGRVTAISRHGGEYVEALQGVLRLQMGPTAKKP